MKVKMPYGEVEIVTKNDAVQFLRHACDNCYRNNLMTPCSGAMAQKCNDAKDLVVKEFSNN